MPVLLLARGDQDSKSMLRHAIEARYGLGPPAIDTLRLELKGRTRTKIGPVATWVPLEGVVYFKFPDSVRWDYAVRPAGVKLSRNASAFDGTTCRKRHGTEPISVINDAERVASAWARLWTAGAVLLTPLTEHYVELQMADEHTLNVTHVDAKITTAIHFNQDHTIDFTQIDCVNPANGKTQTYTLKLSEGQAEISDLMLPRKVVISWSDEPEMELSPVAAEINPAVDDGLFRLESN